MIVSVGHQDMLITGQGPLYSILFYFILFYFILFYFILFYFILFFALDLNDHLGGFTTMLPVSFQTLTSCKGHPVALKSQ